MKLFWVVTLTLEEFASQNCKQLDSLLTHIFILLIKHRKSKHFEILKEKKPLKRFFPGTGRTLRVRGTQTGRVSLCTSRSTGADGSPKGADRGQLYSIQTSTSLRVGVAFHIIPG